MTSQQINYWKVMNERENIAETKRHNVAYESENERHNRETERQNVLGINENIRHNKATEQLTRASQDIDRERVSVQKSQVGLGYAQLAETSQHNREMERQSDITTRADKWLKSMQYEKLETENQILLEWGEPQAISNIWRNYATPIGSLITGLS